MIEPPRVVELDLQRREQFLHSTGEFGITRRRILHLKQFSRKSAEIMNGSRRSGDGYAGFWNKPVSGDRQDGLGFRCCLSYTAPCFCVAIVEDGVHRIAVTKKDRGEYLGHVKAPLFGSRRVVQTRAAYVHHATIEDLQYLIKSAKTDHIDIHKG